MSSTTSCNEHEMDQIDGTNPLNDWNAIGAQVTQMAGPFNLSRREPKRRCAPQRRNGLHHKSDGPHCVPTAASQKSSRQCSPVSSRESTSGESLFSTSYSNTSRHTAVRTY
ncbi:hypothetical protein COOONC_20167 [Cooperia oncophora]